MTRAEERIKIKAWPIPIGSRRYVLSHNEFQVFLADLTPFAVEARYGDYREKLTEIIDSKMVAEYLKKTKKAYEWLKKRIKN
ncbi:MAG: hypothetical protein L6416_06460 [Candidatus Omnitrophica bacterium]|nr:hypothetical protein [Candidatus Omnitrophota bacterium]